MDKKWSVTQLIAAASLGVLSPVLQLLGGSITTVTGIPLASSIINIFIAPAMIMICLLVIRRFGASTIMYIVLGILSLPLPIGGISGFWPKIPIAIVEGILADLLFLVFKRNEKIASVIIGGLTMLYAGIATVELGRYFDMPGVEQTAKMIYSYLVIPGIIFSAFGGYLGYIIYSKIKNTSVVQRINGG
jgi:hypothetical protein